MFSYLKTKLKEIDNYVFFRVKNTRPFFLPKKIEWPDYLNFTESRIILFEVKIINTVICVLLILTSSLLIIIWGSYIFQAYRLLPDIIVSPDRDLGLRTLIEAENFWRLVVTMIAILAAPLTIWRLIISERKVRTDERKAQTDESQAKTARESHFTDLFTRAVDQLGKVNQDHKPNVEVRLGGIYGLERVAHDSGRDHWPIMETLTAYIRQNTKEKWKEAQEDQEAQKEAQEDQEAQKEDQNEKTPIDIQAALTVIGRRSEERRGEEREEDRRLDLSEIFLRKANFTKAHLGHADLRGANLTKAYLGRANLTKARLGSANLTKARLWSANLTKARLGYANLTKARLWSANLTKAYLGRANLTKAWLWYANLTKADLGRANLTKARLEFANLTKANLEGANFGGAQLDLANLSGAKLWSANLSDAHLEGANLFGANLGGADLSSVHLEHANLCGTKAASAKNLTDEQIKNTFGDTATTLPNNLIRPRHWSDKELDYREAGSEWEKWLESQPDYAKASSAHDSRRP